MTKAESRHEDILGDRIIEANSSMMRISLPEEAAKRLLRGFDTNDPLLRAFLENVDILNIDVAHTEEGGDND
jgi:type I restriction enzyme, R subunit